MFRLTRTQVQPIGLDLGRDSIKMLQLEVVGEGLSVRAAARREYGEEGRSSAEARIARAAELVPQMLAEAPFVGRRCVVSMPREHVHIKNFRLPPMPSVELAAAVKFEVRNLFPFDTDDAVVHYLPAGEVRQGNDVLQELIVLAAQNAHINEHLERLHDCGVIVDSLDAEPYALFRSAERFIRRREDELEVNVLVDIGYGGSQVVIGKGRDVSFMKGIEIGGRHFHDAIATKLGISPGEAQALRRRLIEIPDSAEAPEKRDPVRQAVFDATRSIMEQLGRELSLCLRYYSVTFRGHRPTRVRLLGGEAADAQLQSVLNSMITITVEAGRPLYSVDTSRMKQSERRGFLAEWAVALGLGLRRTEALFGPRDGKPREPMAQLVDLAAAGNAEPEETPAAATRQEAAHA